MEDLTRYIQSNLEKSAYVNYEIIIIKNNSVTYEITECYEQVVIQYHHIKVVKYKGDYNDSAVNNLGVEHTTGDYIILLNNDTEVITMNWMEELLMYAQREDVGAVGGKLYYPNKTIQHAGVVIGLGAHRTAGHTHYGQYYQNLGYMGRLCYAQNVTAVTGACLMIKKSLFTEVDGLDETFQISLNDVAFCLKLRQNGNLNVFMFFG